MKLWSYPVDLIMITRKSWAKRNIACKIQVLVQQLYLHKAMERKTFYHPSCISISLLKAPYILKGFWAIVAQCVFR